MTVFATGGRPPHTPPRKARVAVIGGGLAGITVALAAMLVIPTGLGLFPSAMDGVFVLGFTGAVVGGLDSPVGAVVGGALGTAGGAITGTGNMLSGN